MCSMEWGVFLFFAAWIFIMTLGVWFFLPETKGVPVESVPALFARHWFWKKVMGPHAEEVRSCAYLLLPVVWRERLPGRAPRWRARRGTATGCAAPACP